MSKAGSAVTMEAGKRPRDCMGGEGLVLGIETSCDETGAAVVAGGTRLLSNVVATQIDIHRRFGGVVPEIASRRHVETLLPVVQQALDQAGLTLKDLDAVAVTQGPGLVGALLVGIAGAKALAYAAGLPLVAVNHIEGHLYANRLEYPELEPPFLGLIASGGHTELLVVENWGVYRRLGRTRDDAAGEAIDKIGRAMGLAYPAGAELDRLASQGDPTAFSFPRALRDGYDFSFSGLKTAALNLWRRLEAQGEVPLADFAASFQEAVVGVLAEKTLAAAQEVGARAMAVAGGVAANSRLRRLLVEGAERLGVPLYVPRPALCTDNAAMIAAAGWVRWARGEHAGLELNAAPDLSLDG